WDSLAGALPRLRLAANLAAIWDAEREVASRMDSGSYDFCVVHACWLTQTPALLRRIRSQTLYVAQEPRRQSIEAALRRRVFGASQHPLTPALMYSGVYVLRRSDERAMASAGLVVCNSSFSAESIYRT